jgi:hypothetical protein
MDTHWYRHQQYPEIAISRRKPRSGSDTDHSGSNYAKLDLRVRIAEDWDKNNTNFIIRLLCCRHKAMSLATLPSEDNL